MTPVLVASQAASEQCFLAPLARLRGNQFDAGQASKSPEADGRGLAGKIPSADVQDFYEVVCATADLVERPIETD